MCFHSQSGDGVVLSVKSGSGSPSFDTFVRLGTTDYFKYLGVACSWFDENNIRVLVKPRCTDGPATECPPIRMHFPIFFLPNAAGENTMCELDAVEVRKYLAVF